MVLWLEEASLRINTPVNLEDLKQNESYENVLIELYNFRQLRIKWLKNSKLDIENFIEDINKEISKIED